MVRRVLGDEEEGPPMLRDREVDLGQTSGGLTAKEADEKFSLYLDRCQVDTPDRFVQEVWRHVLDRRKAIGTVVDFGAGDARFARYGKYEQYVGYEVDPLRCAAVLPENARLIKSCAFSSDVQNASLCLGNPPFVRNQDLPQGWREHAAQIIKARTGVSVSGLGNAWQYFFFLALASTAPDGLVALIVPFEWVSRPSAKALREYIASQGWEVSVYRLQDKTFDRVLTTSSITVIDKSKRAKRFSYFQYDDLHQFHKIKFATGKSRQSLSYTRAAADGPRAKRGLSPGTQDIFTLSEGQRVRYGLAEGRDVVPCVTSLRKLEMLSGSLTEAVFRKHFVEMGRKCWLVRADRKPSAALRAYLDSFDASARNTSTCNKRIDWWRFRMPEIPALLCATGFRSKAPKIFRNAIKARAVGGVAGIYGIPQARALTWVRAIAAYDFSSRVVAHSRGLRKLEINQLNDALAKLKDRFET